MLALSGRLGRGLGLKCLCSEVICHLRGFPQLCVGHSVGVEKADFPVVFTLAIMCVCMLIFVEKSVSLGMSSPHYLKGIWVCAVGSD